MRVISGRQMIRSIDFRTLGRTNPEGANEIYEELMKLSMLDIEPRIRQMVGETLRDLERMGGN